MALMGQTLTSILRSFVRKIFGKLPKITMGKMGKMGTHLPQE